MSDWWSMENSRTHFSTFLLVLLVQLKVPREFNRVQPELWNPLQTAKAIHSDSSANITQAEEDHPCSRDTTSAQPPQEACFLIDNAKLLIFNRSCAAFFNSLFALRRSVSLSLVGLQTKFKSYSTRTPKPFISSYKICRLLTTEKHI